MLLKFFSLFFLAVITAFPQTKDSIPSYSFPAVYISASKMAQTPRQVSSTISSIEMKEINAYSVFSLYDLLGDEFGLSLARYGGPGQLSFIYTRGANAGQTLITLDGIELNMVNDPTNTVDLANILLDNIERIEIVRGPQSTLYGSEAFGGLVNLFSANAASSKNTYYLNTEAGSYNTLRLSGGLSGSFNALQYSIQGSRYMTDGFSSAGESYGNFEKDGTRNYNLIGRALYAFSSPLQLSLIAKFTKADTDLDQFGGNFGDDSTYISSVEEQGLKAELSYKTSPSLNIVAASSYIRNIRKYQFDVTANNSSSSNSRYDGNKLKNEIRANFNPADIVSGVAGVELENETAISEYYNYSSFGDFLSVFPKSSMQSTAVYTQAQIDPVKNLSGSYGIRYTNHEKFGGNVTFRIGQGYFIEAINTKLTFTYGTGYKAPSLFYLFDPAYGNDKLNPEKSAGWDTGFEFYLVPVNGHLGIKYHDTKYSDLFGFDSNFKTINTKKAEASGIELYSKADVLSNVSVKTSYTYLKTIDKSEGSADFDKKLLRRPEHKFALNILYSPLQNLTLSARTIFTGERDDMDFGTFPATRKVLDSYLLVHLAATYQLNSFTKIYLRGENLLNEKYEEVLGYGNPRLSVFAGVRLSYDSE